MAGKVLRCVDGRHVPSRTPVRMDAPCADPELSYSRCVRCGHLLVKSPITHRWRLTGSLG